MNANPTNAGALRHLSEDSLDSRDAEAEVSLHQKTDLNTFVPDEADNSIGTTYDSIISMIKPDFHGAVTPNSVSIFGCARSDDNDELERLIDAAGPGGEVRLCPGKVEFNNEIKLTKSITIACAGPKFSCIFDGNGVTRHLYSASSSAYAFSGIAFINGFSDGVNDDGFGGSVNFDGDESSLFDRCLFYNNRVKGSFGPGGGAIYMSGKTIAVNNCVFLGNVATSTSECETNGGAIYVYNSNLSVLDCTFKKNSALQDDPTTFGGGGAIYMLASDTNPIDLLVAGSVFELNEASDYGGVALIKEYDDVGKVNVVWINNNELIFGNTDNDRCDGVLVKRSNTCASVGDNFSV